MNRLRKAVKDHDKKITLTMDKFELILLTTAMMFAKDYVDGLEEVAKPLVDRLNNEAIDQLIK